MHELSVFQIGNATDTCVFVVGTQLNTASSNAS